MPEVMLSLKLDLSQLVEELTFISANLEHVAPGTIFDLSKTRDRLLIVESQRVGDTVTVTAEVSGALATAWREAYRAVEPDENKNAP